MFSVNPIQWTAETSDATLWATFPYPPGVSTEIQRNRSLFLAPVLDAVSVARQAGRDEERIFEFTNQKMAAMNGQLCNKVTLLEKESNERFQILRAMAHWKQKEMAFKLPDFEEERDLYFQLRKERDEALQIAWNAFFDWQKVQCDQESGWFSNPQQQAKDRWTLAMKGMSHRTLAMRLSYLRYLSRLTLEQRRLLLQ